MFACAVNNSVIKFNLHINDIKSFPKTFESKFILSPMATRPFSAGSRQAPDPYDQYLEREGFYRKHTARDSTCLFRVVSEQVFDVQLYHEKARSDCIKFMRKRRNLYEQKIDGNYDEYLDEMSKYRSYGSFLELDALAHTYQRNVLLFQPYNCGNWFVKRDFYKDTMMIFFSPDKHFDSIYSTRYIEQAAYCQALVYEILYVNVFKLPDVMYSVERMLHDPEGKTMVIERRRKSTGEVVEDRIVTKEGRVFKLNTAEETECVLNNYRLCHFHNKENFSLIADSYRCRRNDTEAKESRSAKVCNGKGSQGRDLTLLNPMLFEKSISCVRQLLQEGITPFPYKVAKALDSSIYRNIEFDSWSDMRRELKYRNWYYGGNNLQVGVKCMVRLNDNGGQLFYCYIQEIKPNKGPCVVYVEDLGECRTVEYEKLQPLPPEEIRAWIIPPKSRKFSGVPHIKMVSDHHSKKKLQSNLASFDYSKQKIFNDDTAVTTDSNKSFCFSVDNGYSFREIQPAALEMVLMPFLLEHDRNKHIGNKITSINNDGNDASLNQSGGSSSSGVHEMYSISSIPTYNDQSFHFSFTEPVTSEPNAPSTYYAHPYPFTSSYPMYGSHATPMFNAMIPPVTNGSTATGMVNFQAMPSFVPNGSDLPLYDMATLRHFYNLGVHCFHQHHDFRTFAVHPQILPDVQDVEPTQRDVRCVLRQIETENYIDISPNNIYHADNIQHTLDVQYTNDSVLPSKRKTVSSKSTKKLDDTKISQCKDTTVIEPSAILSSGVHVKQEYPPAFSDSTNEVTQDYSHPSPCNAPEYSSSTTYSSNLPYYGVDSSYVDPAATQVSCYVPAYMVHPYGPVIAPAPPGGAVAPQLDFITMHDNRNTPNSIFPFINCNGFPPMVYGPSQTPSAYTVWRYPHQAPCYVFDNCNNGARNYNECEAGGEDEFTLM